MPLIPYNLTTVIVYTSGKVKRMKDCNGFTVTNTGDTILRVNDKILYPGVPGTSLGDSWAFGGNEGEIYTGDITIQFDSPGGAAPEAEVTQKFYT